MTAMLTKKICNWQASSDKH